MPSVMSFRVVALGVAGLVLAGCASTAAPAVSRSVASQTAAFTTRTTTSGPVSVSVTPTRLDASGASFAVRLDNHEVELDGDYAATSELRVGGTTWRSARWSGDSPGGHHRSGTLSFTPGGPVNGAVQLRIGGLPTPVLVTWEGK